MSRKLLICTALAATLGATSANAWTYTYVGEWEVDDGPYWASSPPDGPLAYTGQEAAALLFGGSASDYVISTNGSSTATINFDAWYSVIGYYGPYNGGNLLPDNYSDKYLGLYYGPTYGYPFGDPYAAASSYVWDNAQGSQFTNYAFVVSSGVPEASTWAMMVIGFAGLGLAGYRASRKVALSAA